MRYKMLIKGCEYTISMENKVYNNLLHKSRKITLGILNKVLKHSNSSLFKQGLNVVGFKSSNEHTTNNSIMFNFYEDTNTISVFKISNKYISFNEEIKSFQFVETLTISSYKANKHKPKTIKPKTIKPLIRTGLKIVKG